jgi:penicillin-binding protein 1C
MKTRLLVGIALALALLVGLAHAVPLPERLTAPGATLVLYRDGSVAHALLAPDGRLRVPASLDEVDPRYVEALVAIEDQRFWWHPGVDPLALLRALGQDLWAGEVVSGASTLTMQVARMAEPRPRTLSSKLIEVLRALQLEILWDKRAILEAYLTLAPYGRNLEGIESAALGCLGHRPSALTDAEIALLLAIPQDPTDRYPAAAHEPALRQARDRVAVRMARAGLLQRADPGALPDLLAAPVPTALAPLPRQAPHAARWMAERAPAARVPTTLERGSQAAAERVLGRFVEEARAMGIHNGAVVVVESQTGALAALVGNFDFWDAEHGGQVPAFSTPRSPGSALKPFLYGVALDRGLVLPEHLVPDLPVRYGSWVPDNYDGTFSGMVSIEDALSRSLNVPFIQLLDQLGTESFLAVLRGAGAHSLQRSPGYYGLSLVAGGVELTALEVAGLYTALANDGVPRELVWRQGQTGRALPRMMSPGAAWLTRRALQRRDRPDFPGREAGAVGHHVHWKTGTSYGHRDAWAVGSGERYTVAVWLGNVDNAPSARLVGAAAAGPVLFDVLDALSDPGPARDPAPDDLESVEVCALSGRLPTPSCPHRGLALAPRATVPVQRCELHAEIEVDVASGERVGPGCRAGRQTEARSAVVWPPEVRRYLQAPQGPALPPLAAACGELIHGPPRIVSPDPELVTVLLPGLAADAQEVALEADAGPGELVWFVDGVLVGRSAADEIVWWTPQPGDHLVVVQDRAGNTDKRRLVVR